MQRKRVLFRGISVSATVILVAAAIILALQVKKNPHKKWKETPHPSYREQIRALRAATQQLR
ncbi:hypothetical protein FRC0426_00135 [Corynebacterium diphtheriae]|nr:hypothetical protein FRC0426_00135 [Corynebacterium diphtheriae]